MSDPGRGWDPDLGTRQQHGRAGRRDAAAARSRRAGGRALERPGAGGLEASAEPRRVPTVVVIDHREGQAARRHESAWSSCCASHGVDSGLPGGLHAAADPVDGRRVPRPDPEHPPVAAAGVSGAPRAAAGPGARREGLGLHRALRRRGVRSRADRASGRRPGARRRRHGGPRWRRGSWSRSTGSTRGRVACSFRGSPARIEGRRVRIAPAVDPPGRLASRSPRFLPEPVARATSVGTGCPHRRRPTVGETAAAARPFGPESVRRRSPRSRRRLPRALRPRAKLAGPRAALSCPRESCWARSWRRHGSERGGERPPGACCGATGCAAWPARSPRAGAHSEGLGEAAAARGSARPSSSAAAPVRLRRSFGRAASAEPAAAGLPLHVRRLGRARRKEHLVGLYLDAQNGLLHRETISIGSLNTTRTHPREILYPAIAHLALGFILAHNHPSGCLEPSPEDVEFHPGRQAGPAS